MSTLIVISTVFEVILLVLLVIIISGLLRSFAPVGNDLIACSIFVLIGFRLTTSTLPAFRNRGLIVRGLAKLDVGICEWFCLGFRWTDTSGY